MSTHSQAAPVNAPALGGWRLPILRLDRLLALHRQRRDLAMLDDHLLQDVGLTREEALHEAARPVWDVPATWRN